MDEHRGRAMKHKKVDLRPSLVAQFDDIVRKSNVLRTGCEVEFATFAVNQEECRKKWLTAVEENDQFKEQLKYLETENSTLDTQIKHARKQAEYELQRRRNIEREKEDMARQIEVIRELLSDRNSKSILHEHDRERLAAFTNSHRQNMSHMDTSTTRLNTIMEGSASFLSDVSFDKTEEDPLSQSRLRSGKSWKRPSAPPEELENTTPPKRYRDGNEENTSMVTATITIDTAGKPSATVETNIPKLNKSFSEPTLDKHGIPKNDCGAESDDDLWTAHDVNSNANFNRNYRSKPRKSILKSTPETPVMRKTHSASSGLNRVHIFISKTVIKPETCVPCGRKIRFGKLAMKCKDCRAVCHPECKEKLPLPCIPSCPSTPGNKLAEGVISDFAPLERPMIPRLIVNCANEVEHRGLDEVGIYRVPGSDREQKELKEKFLKGRYPNLSNIHDIHVVCGCLKDFLRGLKEPLVTFSLWEKFVKASGLSSVEKCQEQLVNLIDRLPQANKDTLAFLLQHLQTVSIHPACKMPVPNLAKVFGPTLIGYSCSQPEPMQLMGQTQQQHLVMERLLEIPGAYWNEILCVDEISLFPVGTPYTPDSPQNFAPRSMLGPVNTPDMYPDQVSRSQSMWKGQTPSRYSKKPSRFFSSPVVVS